MPRRTEGPHAERHPRGAPAGPWEGLAERMRASGLRWTPQRRALVAVLRETNGHVSAAELIERCRARDPATTPSTVYRTLDVLEVLGLVRHGHGIDGRGEYHVLPQAEHGHLYCRECGATREISDADAAALVAQFETRHGFAVDLSHVTIVGRCRSCGEAARRVPGSAATADRQP